MLLPTPDLFGLLVVALATFFLWETILPLVPVRIPGLVQGVLVYGSALGLQHVPLQWVFPAAVAGAVGILHRTFGSPHIPAVWHLPQLRPDKPQERARRIPGLP